MPKFHEQVTGQNLNGFLNSEASTSSTRGNHKRHLCGPGWRCLVLAGQLQAWTPRWTICGWDGGVARRTGDDHQEERQEPCSRGW